MPVYSESSTAQGTPATKEKKLNLLNGPSQKSVQCQINNSTFSPRNIEITKQTSLSPIETNLNQLGKSLTRNNEPIPPPMQNEVLRKSIQSWKDLQDQQTGDF